MVFSLLAAKVVIFCEKNEGKEDFFLEGLDSLEALENLETLEVLDGLEVLDSLALLEFPEFFW